VTRTDAVNYTLYQTGWFACILGAAWRHEAAGVATALVLTLAHVLLSRERGIELRLLALAVGTGWVVESTQIASGTYRATSSVLPDGAAPAWLLALWAQFATTWRYSLSGILRRPARAALFGAIGGPLAFYAADRLGALTLLSPVGDGLIRVSAMWAAALLLFSWLTRRWSPSGEAPAYRQALPDGSK
jgi:hypothetical protein